MKQLIWISAACILAGCSNAKHMQQTNDPQPPAFDLQGHRGCRGLMPENTISAFMKARALGVATLEMDVVITKDSQVLVSHEPFFNHEISTKPNGEPVTEAEEKLLNIYRMTYEETMAYDVGKKQHPRFAEQEKTAEHKPLLKTVFSVVNDFRRYENIIPQSFYNIEIKCLPEGDGVYHPLPGPFTELVMAVVREAGMEKFVNIQSFDFRVLQYMHAHYPNIRTAALVEADDKTAFAKLLEKLGYIPTSYSPHYSLVTPLLVQQCRAIGMKLIPWTVNDIAEAKRLKKMGVDGLITDYPDRIR